MKKKIPISVVLLVLIIVVAICGAVYARIPIDQSKLPAPVGVKGPKETGGHRKKNRDARAAQKAKGVKTDATSKLSHGAKKPATAASDEKKDASPAKKPE